uniref:Putative secreted protein n=1 Tax=Ixodes ricinus TaxID=34613 RepID=A0A6B0UT64_IXORI
MKVQTKLIIVGTVMILHAIQKGVLSQEPSPSPCYDAIKAVGEIFCTITGQHGFLNFLWPPYPKLYVILCKDVYLNLSIPFNVTDVEIIVPRFLLLVLHLPLDTRPNARFYSCFPLLSESPAVGSLEAEEAFGYLQQCLF